MKNPLCAKRLPNLFFAVFLVLSATAFIAVPAFAEADEPTTQASGSSLVAGAADDGLDVRFAASSYAEAINPLYADELAGRDLVNENAPALRKYPYEYNCATEEEAVERIREAMLLYQADIISVTIKTDVGDAEYGLKVFERAFAEPDENSLPEYASKVDYLRYNYMAVGCNCEYSFSDGGCMITYTYNVTFCATKSQSTQLFDAAEQRVESFGFNENTSDVQKFKTIYDFICGHVVYDYAHLENKDYLLKYSAYAALMNGTAVCQGYTQLLYVMCGLAGVPTRIISGLGNGGPHAWNIVGLEQNDDSILYYNVDSTWDSSLYQTALPYEFFLLSDDDFKDHERESWGGVVDYGSPEFYAVYPMAETSYAAPLAIVGDIEYTLVGDEAIASAYKPSTVSGEEATTKLVIPESVMLDDKVYTVTAIGEGFMGSPEAAEPIQTVALPATIKSIGISAFEQSSISSIGLPEGLLRIGDYAFWSCNHLREITLPASLELVGKEAFEYCLGLEKVKVLGPTAIGEGAFVGLKGYDLASGNAEQASTLTVSTPCQHRLILDNGDTYITKAATALILAEGVSFEAGHRLVHFEEAPATCESAGFAEYWECRVCGKLFADEGCTVELKAPSAYKPLGHSWDEGVVAQPATETEEGVRIYTCTRCDAVRSEAIPVLMWKLVSTVEPTCTADGYHLYTNANGEEKRESIPALGHAWDEGTVYEPTCTEEGCTVHGCTRCRFAYSDSVKPALGHSFTNYVSNEDATCEADGTKTASCNRGCGATETVADEGSALGHEWGDWVIDSEAKCTETGKEHRTCARNPSHSETRAIPALGHEYHSDVTKPTCTKGGYTTHTCSRCGDSYTDAKTAALGHKWDAGKVTTAPTYTAKGVRTFACTRCKATRTEAIAMLPKLAQAIAPAKKTYTVKFSKARKKAQKIAVRFKASGGGKVAYKAAKAAGGKVKIAKNGMVTVAKGTKKGTYTLKVKVTAPETGKYAKTTKTVKLKIRVK